jgi:PQQ-like domain
MRKLWLQRRLQRLIRAGLLVSASVAFLHAQGRGGAEWTTSGFDAQRSHWLRGDARLTKDAVQKGEFAFLWSMKIENTSRQLNSLTPPVLLDRLIGYRGFKSLAFFGGSDDRVFAVDTDLARPAWTTILNYSAATGGRPSSSMECPGGLTAMPSRRTTLAVAAPTVGGGRGGVRNGSAVGEPGRGAAVLGQSLPQRGAPAAAPARGRGPAPIGFGRVDPLFVVGGDGFIHSLYVSNGAEMEPPMPFIPPDTKPSAVIWVDGVVYTTTSGGCGGAPNAVWALDFNKPSKERKTISWKSGSANIAGASGLAFGGEGTIYVALGSGAAATPPPDSIVALNPETLTTTDWFTAGGVDFNATPTVFRHKNRELVAATANDGRLYLLDAKSLGGSDHKTPLAVTAKFTDAGAATALATFEDGNGRWIFATASGATGDGAFAQNGAAPNGRVVAFRLRDAGEKLSLEPVWQSQDLTAPLAPIVVDGLVFAVSSGEYRGGPSSLPAAQRAQRSVPAVLYVLDGATGKTIWNSGTKITSFARGGLSAGGGQVYLVTYDNQLYAFGIPLEH